VLCAQPLPGGLSGTLVEVPARHRLTTRSRQSSSPWGTEVDISIDGVDLYEWLGLSRSQWIAPPRDVLCPPSDHLLGGPDRWEDPQDPWFDDGRVALAACTCGQPGCRAVLARVTMSDDVVIWSGFSTYRDGVPIEAEFRFNPRQYRAALRELCGGGT